MWSIKWQKTGCELYQKNVFTSTSCTFSHSASLHIIPNLVNAIDFYECKSVCNILVTSNPSISSLLLIGTCPGKKTRTYLMIPCEKPLLYCVWYQLFCALRVTSGALFTENQCLSVSRLHTLSL